MPASVPPRPLDDPSALTRFGRLELVARLVVEGVLSGLHASPFKGASVEFAEHRQYGPGDEIRHIDWRAYGKNDRYFVKEYEEETNLKALLIVDASGSMAYKGNTAQVSKLEQARRVAASLAYLMTRQRDAVGLATFDTDLRAIIPPRSNPGHFAVICRALEDAAHGGETAISTVLHRLADRFKRRGLMILLTDAFEPVSTLAPGLRHLRHRGHEVIVFHILAPEEETFPFRRPSKFRDLEHVGPPVRVEPAALRATYLERFEAFRRELKQALGEMEVDYHKISTADSADQALLGYLAARAGRARPGRGRGAGGARG